jgi:hypothetical protein
LTSSFIIIIHFFERNKSKRRKIKTTTTKKTTKTKGRKTGWDLPGWGLFPQADVKNGTSSWVVFDTGSMTQKDYLLFENLPAWWW